MSTSTEEAVRASILALDSREALERTVEEFERVVQESRVSVKRRIRRNIKKSKILAAKGTSPQ